MAELRQLMTAAYERERLAKEFEQMARDRAAGRAEYEDTGSDWQAMSPKLRQAIDAYNREPAQVQAEILERFSRTPALEKSLGEDLNRRRALCAGARARLGCGSGDVSRGPFRYRALGQALTQQRERMDF